MTAARLSILGLALLVPSCTTVIDNGDPFGSGGGHGSTSHGGESEAGSNGSTRGAEAGESLADDGSSDHGIKFDTPGGADDGLPGAGCENIDFLFVIDNSGSMSPHQQNLIANFGPFIDTIAAEVAGHDYHVMAIDSDGCTGGSCLTDDCEAVLGAGQVRSCNMPGGLRYLTSDLDLETIADTFACVANVGDLGSASELPMSAMIEAIDPLNAAGQCNAGFVRDDAVLVVTIISDDHTGWFGEDDVAVGNVQAWYDALVDVKGDPDRIVVLGLFALLEDQSCIGFGPNESTRFIELVELFGDHGILGSVCTPDYNAFFAEAVGLVDTTCDEFVPQG